MLKLLILICLLSAVCGINLNHQEHTLNDYYYRNKVELANILSGIDLDCVEEKLDFVNYGCKIMDDGEACSLIVTASWLCSDQLKISKEQELEDMKTVISLYPIIMKCTKRKVTKYKKPNEPLLNNFYVQSMSSVVCENLLSEVLVTDIKQFLYAVAQPALLNDYFKCYDLDTKERKNILAIVLSEEARTDDQNDEIEKYLEKQKLEYGSSFYCLMKPVGDMRSRATSMSSSIIYGHTLIMLVVGIFLIS